MVNVVVNNNLDLPEGSVYIVLTPNDEGFSVGLYDTLIAPYDNYDDDYECYACDMLAEETEDKQENLKILARGVASMLENDLDLVFAAGFMASVQDELNENE